MTTRHGAAQYAELMVPLHYLGQLRHYLDEHGVDTRAWLSAVGLGDADLLSEDKKLPLLAYQQLILSAVQLAPYPHVGLEIGSRLRVHSHGLLGLAVMNCRTLQEVLDIFCRYLAIRTPLVSLGIIKTEDVLRCQFTERVLMGPVRVYFLEALLATFYQLFKELSGQACVFRRIELPFPAPEYADVYTRVFQCEVVFACEHCVVTLSQDILSTPIGLPDQRVLADTLKLCDQQLAQLATNQGYADKVRQMLLVRPEALPDSEQVARQLNLTKRTLHRYLRKEGTQYQDILDKVKAELARHYLQDCGYSVKQCAFMIGYADVANFRRAFKRWHGMAPSHWQQRLSGEQD